MGKKRSRRKRPASPFERLERLPPDNRDEATRLKASLDLLETLYGQPGTIGYSLAHAEEIQRADSERARYERAAEELRLEEIKKELRRKARSEEPGARAGTKLTPAIIASHLAAVPMDKTHSDGRPWSWQDRADWIRKTAGVSVKKQTVMRALKKKRED